MTPGSRVSMFFTHTIIGGIAGVLVVFPVSFVQRTLKIDHPVDTRTSC